MVLTQAALLWLGELVLLGCIVWAWAPAGRTVRSLDAVLATGIGLLTAGIVLRWVLVAHPPIFGTYENSLAAGWYIAVSWLALRRGWLAKLQVPGLARAFATWLVPVFVLGWFFNQVPYPLTISERSWIVDVHVLFAWAAHTAFLGVATAAVFVALGKSDADTLDEFIFRGTGAGFAFLTLMLAVGSYYSFLLFADWYRWEITETFAAATWLAYGLVLHAIMMFGWKGRRLAWAVLICVPLLLCTFWVWSFWSGTYHHFEIPELRAR